MEIIISLVSIAILITVVSFSYAYIKLEKQEKDVNVLGTDCIKLEMEDVSEGITLHHAFPVIDETGQQTDPYTFKLTNQCGVGVNYEIHLRVEETEEDQIAASNIATSVDGEGKVKLTNKVNTEDEPEEYRINKEDLTLDPYETVEHNVRIWLDENAGNETQNKTFKSKVIIEAVQNQTAMYTEKILNGADPVLNNTEEETNLIQTASGEEITNNDTLVPVIISDDGKVTKADVTEEWYDYETKRWANAVILVDNSKADTIKAGTEIDEKDIESYFVWIPKYQYKLFNLEKYENIQEGPLEDKGANTPIEIEFGLEDTTNDKDGECTTPNASGADGQCQKGDWMTHPAFLAFKNSKGMWVGKFETGYNQGDNNSNTIEVTDSWTESNAQKNENAPKKVIIKPHVYSWRGIDIVNMYQNSFNYERDLDSHMMKNTEWGAVAYLSNSKYGMCTGSSCKEVELNKNDNYKTAYSESNVASTTGNSTGIFDLNGGSWEYVAGVMTSSNTVEGVNTNNIQFGSSGLNVADITDLKYIDLYLSGKWTNYNHRILGDATGEMGPFKKQGNNFGLGSWYGDKAAFVNESESWFARGGRYEHNEIAGLFHFDSGPGNAAFGTSFRIVLTPINNAL